LDKWLGIGPWGLIVGGMGGSAVGFYAFIRSANKLMDEQKKQDQQKKQQQDEEKKP
jgi:F0F1-type ATP synthase assembly protein I